MKCWKKSAGRWWLRNRYHISSGTLSNWQIWPSLANSISRTCRCASYPADLIIGLANMYLLIVFCSRFLFLLLSSLTEIVLCFHTFSYIFSLKEFPLYTFTWRFCPTHYDNRSLFYFSLRFTLMQVLAYFLNTCAVSHALCAGLRITFFPLSAANIIFSFDPV